MFQIDTRSVVDIIELSQSGKTLYKYYSLLSLLLHKPMKGLALSKRQQIYFSFNVMPLKGTQNISNTHSDKNKHKLESKLFQTDWPISRQEHIDGFNQGLKHKGTLKFDR